MYFIIIVIRDLDILIICLFIINEKHDSCDVSLVWG